MLMMDQRMQPAYDYSEYLKFINNCDPSDPLLSQTKLGQCLDRIPLELINPTEFGDLYLSLNCEQLIRTEDGLARDYRGLAELMGFTWTEIESKFGRSSNAMQCLIDAFIHKRRQQQNAHHLTVNELLKIIEKIERFDVIDDILPTLVRLAHSFANQNQTDPNSRQLNPLNQDYQAIESSVKQLTIDDTDRSITHYDAFVCFAPEDFDLAQELIHFLNSNGKTMATANDLLPGQFEYNALAQLIEQRCRKIIIILTRNFLQSRQCTFPLEFSNEITIRDREQPRLVPLLYESCDDNLLPSLIRFTSKIDMTNTQLRRWQLDKLLRSLSVDGGSRHAFTNHHPHQAGHSVASLSTMNESSSPVPAITLGELQELRYPQQNSTEPIVDLLQSEVSRCNIPPQEVSNDSGLVLTARRSSPKPSASSNSNAFSWFRRKVLGSSSPSESIRSNTSKLLLIPNSSNSTESLTSECETPTLPARRQTNGLNS